MTCFKGIYIVLLAFAIVNPSSLMASIAKDLVALMKKGPSLNFEEHDSSLLKRRLIEISKSIENKEQDEIDELAGRIQDRMLQTNIDTYFNSLDPNHNLVVYERSAEGIYYLRSNDTKLLSGDQNKSVASGFISWLKAGQVFNRSILQKATTVVSVLLVVTLAIMAVLVIVSCSPGKLLTNLNKQSTIQNM